MQASFSISNRDEAVQEGLSKAFAFFWYTGVALTVLDLGRNFGFGNVNPLERSLFLIAAGFFVFRRPFVRQSVIGVCLIATATLLSALVTDFSSFDVGRYLMAAIALFTFLAFLVVEPRAQDVEVIIKSVKVLPAVLLAVGVMFWAVFGRAMTQIDHTGANRLGGAVMPAYLALACYSSCVASSALYIRDGKKLDLAWIGFAVVVCALSGSRTASVCCALILFLSLAASSLSSTAKILGASYAMLMAGGALFTVGDQLLSRFMSGSTSGREQIWAALLAVADRYPVLGIGFGHHGLVVPSDITKFTGTAASHNEFIRLYTELGWLGSVLFAMGWMLLWTVSLDVRVGRALLQTGFFLSFLLMSSTDNTLFATYSLFGLLCGVYVLTVIKQRK